MLRKYAIGQAQFDESKVRRDEDGRFASKGSGGAPSFQQRQLVEASPGRLFEEKWRPRGAGLFQQGKSSVPGREHRVVTSWERLGTKNAELPPEYTGSKQRELPVDGYLAHEMTWQQPKAYTRKQHDAIRGALVSQIVENRQGAIERATENGLIPEGTSKKLINRAYNLASMRALHEFGVGRFDYKMTDQLKEEMRPLTPAMRYFQRRIGNAMRSDPRTKGLWEPYKEEFGEPYPDRRLDRRQGKQNQMRLRWPTSQGPHTEFIKADAEIGDLLKRKAGTPLTEAERQQRSEAAKARWAKRSVSAPPTADAAAPALPRPPLYASNMSPEQWDAWTKMTPAEKARESAIAMGVSIGGAVGALATLKAANMVEQKARQVRRNLKTITEYAPSLKNKMQRYSHYNRLLEPGETLVFRGAPTLDVVPQKRRYRAVYAAQDPSTSLGYTRGSDGVLRPINHGAFAVAPTARLFDTSARNPDKEAQRAVAAARLTGILRNQMRGSSWADRKKRALDMAASEQAIQHYLYNTHIAPGKEEVIFLRRKGYAGTVGQSRNVALFNENDLRFIAPAPNMGHYDVSRDRGMVLRGVRSDGMAGPWSVNRTMSRSEIRAARKMGAALASWRRGNLLQRLAVRAIGVAPKVLKAHFQAGLAKSEAVHPGARRTLDLADKIMAAHDAQPAPRRATAAEMAPPEVRATLPLARRILREHAGEQAAMAQAPGRTRHRAGERVIRDPRRSLSDLLG